MASHDVVDRLCPACGWEFNAATNVSPQSAAPAPGDITICIGCGQCLQYAVDMTPVLFDKTALHPLDLREVERVQALIKRLNEIAPGSARAVISL